MIQRLGRLLTIERVFVKYGFDELFLRQSPAAMLRYVFYLSPTRWMHQAERAAPRGERIRHALEELGPVFVKLGQMLSTRRDLLPEDIGDELAKLQDRVAPFDGEIARRRVETVLGAPIATLFARFEQQPLASASVAQVHGAELHDGRQVVVKVLRPSIDAAIRRDVSLMYLLAAIAARVLPDARRLKPREVVEEYDATLQGELDLVREATNAMVLRKNFEGSDKLYIPEVHWEMTRTDVMVMERIDGISIRDIPAMKAIGMDMKKLAEHGVEIFFTQVFTHNFFHADMHPGNIFVSRDAVDHPQYIAVDFGIVGSLTDEDLRYIGENLLAFFQRDYRRVAQLHIDSGWVPRDTRVTELEFAVRAVCEPIFDKPLAEISFGNVLVQLFHVARRFEMEVQPQLVLLQKTLLNIEGLGRQLYPELDLWATGKPFLQRWVLKRNSPKVLGRRFLEQAPALLQALPEMPLLVNDIVKLQSSLARQQLQASDDGGGVSGASARGLRLVIVGAALTVSAALIGNGVLAAGGGVPLGAWLLGGAGMLILLRGVWL